MNARDWNFQTDHKDPSFHHFYKSDSSVHFPLKNKNADNKNKNKTIVWEWIKISLDKNIFYIFAIIDGSTLTQNGNTFRVSSASLINVLKNNEYWIGMLETI